MRQLYSMVIISILVGVAACSPSKESQTIPMVRSFFEAVARDDLGSALDYTCAHKLPGIPDNVFDIMIEISNNFAWKNLTLDEIVELDNDGNIAHLEVNSKNTDGIKSTTNISLSNYHGAFDVEWCIDLPKYKINVK